MNKTILKITLCIIALMMNATASYSQQPKAASNLDFVKAKSKRRSNYHNDFLDFANPAKGNFEGRDLTQELAKITENVSDYLDSMWNLIYIYNSLSCQPDKVMVGSLAKIETRHCAQKIEIHIRYVNGIISTIKIPAIATTGTQLKDDLREIKDRLEAIEFN